MNLNDAKQFKSIEKKLFYLFWPISNDVPFLVFECLKWMWNEIWSFERLTTCNRSRNARIIIFHPFAINQYFHCISIFHKYSTHMHECVYVFWMWITPFMCQCFYSIESFCGDFIIISFCRIVFDGIHLWNVSVLHQIL